MSGAPVIGAVTIGRNEGARLVACLQALQGAVDHIVYVDSGSGDDSVNAARSLGAHVVELDTDIPFTAARARNAGLAALRAQVPDLTHVQFLDGDCVLQPGWIDTARQFLQDHADVAVACGRRREKFPEASLYNRLIDAEWNTPIGQAKACGGDALMRVDALAEVGGYDDSLIAGEEPEMCVRLRAKGWKIWRLDAEMTLHDANLTRFGQWWRRAQRGGHAYAEGAAMHGRPPEFHKRRELRSALLWGAALPLLAVAGAILISPWCLALLGAFPAQILRQRAKGTPWLQASFTTLAKLPEAQGALQYWGKRLSGRQSRLIEYK
ncbi:glycosyltransferase [uncultured Tateyamaria sp.]|uniref:glycosyltransferase family 2 protein n=1 Tax=uncultured Tateyamaria sp. TaxID=455651 RepID=UPI00262D9DF3|nr:glycosyltransferase [uncultured Tateyamaria sp.]